MDLGKSKIGGKCRGRGKCNTLSRRERVSEGLERGQSGLPRRFAPRNDVSCHSELTRKLVELAKRNFLFLLGDSESIKRQTLKQVQGDNYISGLPRVHYVHARNDVPCHSEHLLCHSELVSESISIKTL